MRRFLIRYLERVPFRVTLLIVLGVVFTAGVLIAEASSSNWAASGATRIIGLALGPFTIIGAVAAAALFYRYAGADD
jgi:di/tricarboxylate transporter